MKTPAPKLTKRQRERVREIEDRLQKIVLAHLGLTIEEDSMSVLRQSIEKTVVELKMKTINDYQMLLITDDKLPGKIDVRISARGV